MGVLRNSIGLSTGDTINYGDMKDRRKPKLKIEPDKMVIKRRTLTLERCLKVFVDNPKGKFPGSEICRRTKLKSGTIYPMLRRLEEAGWLSGEWEDIDPSIEGRPKRRYYLLTEKGRGEARSLVTN